MPAMLPYPTRVLPSGRNPLEGLLTIPQAAARLGRGEHSIRRAIETGRLPAWSLAGIYLIPERDLDDWARIPRGRAGLRIRRAIDNANRARARAGSSRIADRCRYPLHPPADGAVAAGDGAAEADAECQSAAEPSPEK